MSTTGTITNFKTTPGTQIGVGGDAYEIETAGKSYSITNPDPQTLRFQVQRGDNWGDSSPVDRSEIQDDTSGVKTNYGAMIPAGTPIGMDYQFMVEANGPNGSFVNTAPWFVVGQMHNDDPANPGGVWTSPPFAIQLDGDHLQVVARYVLPGGNPSNSSSDLHLMTLWTDPNPITPGAYNDIKVQANFSNSGGGYLKVSINGNQVVNYQGPLGYGQGTYWEYGLYRETATETAAVDYRNMTLVTGSQAAGWSGVGGTTSSGSTSSPTTPTVTPAVTQATASPGTGIEHAGDTITLSLGFNEAVTVTGTPTLSLNDGNKATYVGGSGTSTLTFKTTVAATDTNTSALAITGVNLPSGASIKDASGVAARLSGAVKTFAGLQIDPISPAVTQASASPGTGTEHVGDAITLTLGFNEAVTVSGTPTLSLNDGGTASYVGGSGTGTLTFKTTVASTNTSTSALAITGVNLPNGANIKDASGVAASLSGAVKTFSGLAVSTAATTPTTPAQPTTPTTPTNVAPTVTQASASPGTGIENVGDTITLTLGFSEAVTVSGTPTLSLNDGAKATYVGGSGTGSLTFKTTVASTDTSVSSLAITGVNLPNGASIKDSSGLAANLSGAVKTFTGLQIDPPTSTTPSAPSTPTTPSSTKPVLTIADHSLSVAGRGGTVDLGTKVTTTDSNDVVTVNITGLPKYETIIDKLDGQTFRGSNITLTAAQVDSGLTLHSYYRGGGHPVATLTLTASAKDKVTGSVSTASPQTITVTDPRPATTTTSSHTTTTSSQASTVTDHVPTVTTPATTTTTMPVTTTPATTTTSPQRFDFTDLQHAIAANAGGLASRAFALLQQHVDPATSTLATTAQQPIIVADHPVAAGTSTASLASQSFALLNQYLAGNTGRVDPGQIVAAVSQASGSGLESLLARPQH
ncbi:heparin lyase I family protein [Bradyrhizobium sp. CCGUVB23]|uniref:heparin lyase I family protein n=1 Tax=Bradyrhizobium sp. CCGUVB23 TaxID=2949630 RepID=UPI0020B1CDC0|nr:heparin lyase I family protein [Bradyrhizobium sp. CCGUVB23]MCP3459283.1 heparin lyase I family protein [Bradyrhizobium sp. CCGUVB23]